MASDRMKTREKGISIREFGRRLGVSDTTVHKAIDANKIVNGIVYVKKNGRTRPWIIESIAMQEWGSTINPNYSQDSQQALASKLGGEVGPNAASSNLDSIAGLKIARAKIQLQKEGLLLQIQKGKYVEKDKVYMALFALAQAVKKNLESIPDRFIHSIRAADSTNEGHNILTAAIKDALAELSDPEKIKIEI
jgi:DNA-binding transcriptional regulator YhcF (GntR family)